MENVLEVRNLSVTFHAITGEVQAVRDISFDLHKGSVTAIVGESGCGKSVTSKSIMGLIKKPGEISPESKIIFQGENIQEYTKKQWEEYRGQKCSICFQDALTALNPTMTIGKQIMEKIRVHKKVTKKEAWNEAVHMLELVGIPNPEYRMRQYPHEFSGGMRQRVMIAIAMTLNPALLIADEPTTALDVTIQAQVMDLIVDLNHKLDMGVMLITHDLAVVAEVCQRVIVMYLGQVVEEADVDSIFDHPQHPYTQGLIRSIPQIDGDKGERLYQIDGMVPLLNQIPEGCRFAPRCTYATDRCRKEMPELREVSATQKVRCHMAGMGA